MGNIRDRLAANSRAYQEGNPVTSRTNAVVSGLAAALFVVFAVILFVNGEVLGGLICVVVAASAAAAVYLTMLGRRARQ